MLLLNYKSVLRQPTGIGVYANAVLPALQNFEHILVPGGCSGGLWGAFKTSGVVPIPITETCT